MWQLFRILVSAFWLTLFSGVGPGVSSWAADTVEGCIKAYPNQQQAWMKMALIPAHSTPIAVAIRQSASGT